MSTATVNRTALEALNSVATKSHASKSAATSRDTRVLRQLRNGASLIGLAATTLFATQPAAAQVAPPPNIVGACSGASLPPSAVTGILTPIINGIVSPIEGTVNPLLGNVKGVVTGLNGLSLLGLGTLVANAPALSIDTTTLLANAAAGKSITLDVLNSNGKIVGALDRCDTQADGFMLRTPAGIAIGGNRITGLGSTGLEATAGEQNSVAFGNAATTDSTAANAIAFGTRATVGANATGAIALGTDAVATGVNSVALGAGSVASAGEVSVGAPGAERRIANIAAGVNATDAVNVAQLAGTAQYDTAAKTRLTLAGAAGTTIANVAPGTLAAGSTEAVNAGQLFATNTVVGNLSTGVVNGSIGTVQYADAATPTVRNGGTPSNDVALVGAAAAPVGLHNVAAGSLAVGSTDAVNGGQLGTVVGQVNGLSGLAVKYDDATHVKATLGGTGAPSVVLGNVASGTLAAGSAEAVNGGQLFTTNAALGTTTTAINTLTTNITNGAVGALQYSSVANPTVPNGGTPSNDAALVGGAAGAVALHNVDTGVVATGSTDAVNGGQLSATNTTVTNLTTSITNGAVGALQYSSAGTPTVPNGGVPSNDAALVGGAAGAVALHNVGAGVVATGSTDAVNGGQLSALSTLAVQYDNPTRVRATLGGTGAAPVALGNVAAGAVTVGSTDAVNGGQLSATNTTVTNLTTSITNGAVGALQYSSAGTPTVPNGGVPSNDAALVGVAAGPVALHNVGTGVVATGSTDAVNGGQLFATNTAVGTTNTALGALRTNVANGGIGTVQYSTAGAPNVANGGVPSNDLALIGATAGPVALHNVAAGVVATGSTDAVNGGQLAAVTGQVGGLSTLAVQYDDATRVRATLGGAGASPVALGNVASGTLAAGSTDAVNAGQLFATNTAVGNTNTALTSLTTNITNGGIGALQYSSAANPTVGNGGVPSNDVALIGATVGPVALHNVAAGVVAAGSTDAVNGDQLATVSVQVGGLSALAVQYDDPTRTRLTLGGVGAQPVAVGNVAAGNLVAGSTDAVNGGQLFATNTTVTNLSTAITNGGIGALQYSSAANPTVANGGVPSNDVTLIGAVAGPVALHNVGAGVVAAGSTDAVNGGQLASVSDQLGGLSTLAVRYDDASRARLTLGGAGAAPVVLGNVAAGTLADGSTEAVNGGQMVTLGRSVAAGLGGLSSYDPASNSVLTSIGFGGQQYGTVQSAFDAVNGAVNGGAGIRFFRVLSTRADGVVTGTDSLAIGPEANASAANSVALGTGSTAARGATAGYAAAGLGGLQNSVGEVSVGAVGAERQITNVAAGTAATDAATVGQVAGVAAQVAALGTSTVQYDNAAKTAITLGGAGGTTLTNVSAGNVAAGSRDAVNGGQLFATNAQVANNTTAITNLGGQIANGATGPVQYSNPGSTTTPNGGTRTNDLTLVGATGGPVALHNVAAGAIQAGSTDAVTGAQVYGLAITAVNAVSYDSDANGVRNNRVTLAGGTAGVPVTIANVAAGTVAAGSTEAVNGGQLQATNQAVAAVQTTANSALSLGSNSVQYGPLRTNVTFNAGGGATVLSNVAAGVSATDAANVGQLNSGINSALTQANGYTDGRIAALDFDIQSVRRDSYAGTSGALAAAGLPQAYEAGKGMVAMGGGTYAGQSAVALGLSKAFSDGHTVVKLSGTYDSQGRGGASGGIGYQF